LLLGGTAEVLTAVVIAIELLDAIVNELLDEVVNELLDEVVSGPLVVVVG
jgi:hypothetical protein